MRRYAPSMPDLDLGALTVRVMSGAEHRIPESTVPGLAAQIWAPMSTLVRCPELIVLSTGSPMRFVHTFCLTAQGLDGEPVYLLDEFLCYRFKLFQDGGGFFKPCAGR